MRFHSIQLIVLVLLAAMLRADDVVRPQAPTRRIVGGRWSTVQTKIPWSQLLKIDEVEGMTRVIVRPDAKLEPMLRGGRRVLIEIDANPLAWTVSTVGRVWADDARLEGSQHLQLVGYDEDVKLTGTPTVARLHATPLGVVIEGWRLQDKQVQRIVLIVGPDRCDLATQPRDLTDPNKLDFNYRTPTVRSMLRQHPREARELLLPLLSELNGGKSPLSPHAADVYRAFADVPVDDAIVQQVQTRLKDANNVDPAVRERVASELRAMDLQAVQVAMKMDRKKLSPSAQQILEGLIRQNSEDDRDAAALLADPYFLQDCATDPDPRIARAAKDRLDHLPKQP